MIEGAGALGVALSEESAARMLRLLDELTKWNRTHNLTAITQREEMVTHHLLDSLSVYGELRGETVADVGTGAGFPGLPLAIADGGARRFTLIDSNNKKVLFVAHAARTLGLTNVTAVHARAESGLRQAAGTAHGSQAHNSAAHNSATAQGRGAVATGWAGAERPLDSTFDTVVARAFAALPELLEKVAPLCHAGTRVLAMKGKRPDEEIAAVPAHWQVLETRPLSVPGLNGERHLVILQQRAAQRGDLPR